MRIRVGANENYQACNLTPPLFVPLFVPYDKHFVGMGSWHLWRGAAYLGKYWTML